MTETENDSEKVVDIIVDNAAPDKHAAADYIEQTQDIIDQIVAPDTMYTGIN